MRTFLAGIFVFFSMTAAAFACPDWQFGGQTYSYSGQQLYTPQQLQGAAYGGFDLAGCSTPGAATRGYASAAPNYTLNLSGMDQYYLVLDVVSQCDATLLVNAADGTWLFDDDSNGNLDPRMELRVPSQINGRVDVWVGTYDNSQCAATLRLETFFSQSPAPAPAPQAAACPDWGFEGARIDATAGSMNFPVSYSLTATGGASLSSCPAIPSARGYGPQAPQYSFWLSGMTGHALDLSVSADCDTVMVVNTADTVWHFDDDSGGSLNPALRLPAGVGLDGRVDVWVGTYGGGACPATVTAQAIPVAQPAPAPSTAGGCPTWNFTGQQITATGQFLYSPQNYAVQASGSTEIGGCNIPGAYGYANAAPDYTFYLSGMEQYRLEIEVSSNCDPVLLVNTADGQWYFNDDSSGLNPALNIRGTTALNGRVDVWVGSYNGAPCPATLEMETWLN
ncbi:MAG: hypothetical protein AAGF88_08750 [Pseudomonadota bacterium]